MPESIQEFREKLQGPRRPYDTWYGRNVMRVLSIYITKLLAQTPVKPITVTLVSVVLGVFGAWLLTDGHWLLGILLVNGWYLLDHVDGELARLRKEVSPTGFYFDTIANAFVPPLTFVGLGIGLTNQDGSLIWLYLGLAAAYASLMFLLIPFCESAILLQWLRDKKGTSLKSAPQKEGEATLSLPRKIFSHLHSLVTFPVILPFLTVCTILLSFAASDQLENALEILVFCYAVTASVVWVFILANKLITRRLDEEVLVIKP